MKGNKTINNGKERGKINEMKDGEVEKWKIEIVKKEKKSITNIFQFVQQIIIQIMLLIFFVEA